MSGPHQQASADLAQGLSAGIPVEFHANALQSSSPHAFAQLLIFQKQYKPTRQLIGIIRVHKKTSLTLNYCFRSPAGTASDHGLANGVGLCEYHAKAFHIAALIEAIHHGKNITQIVDIANLIVANIAGEDHRVLQMQFARHSLQIIFFRSFTGNQILEIWNFAQNLCQSFQHDLMSFARDQPRHRQHDFLALQSVTIDKVGSPGPRLEMLEIDSRRELVDALFRNSDPRQAVTGKLVGGNDGVRVAIDKVADTRLIAPFVNLGNLVAVTKNYERELEHPSQDHPIQGLRKKVATVQAIVTTTERCSSRMQELRQRFRPLPVFPVWQWAKASANGEIFGILVAVELLPAWNLFCQQRNCVRVLGQQMLVQRGIVDARTARVRQIGVCRDEKIDTVRALYFSRL